MKNKWEIDDGYCGGSRPHYVEVDDEELNECETDEERNELIEQVVKDDFNETIYYVWEIEE